MIFVSESCKNFADLRPIVQVWHEDASCPVKISFQAFHGWPGTFVCPSIKFFKHYRTQPKRPGSKLAYCECSFVSAAQCRNVDGSIEQRGLHLIECAVDVFDLYTTADKTFIGG